MNIKSWKAWRVLGIGGILLLSILAGFPLSSKGAEPIKIGVIQPLTGPIAFDGQNQVKAIELAVEKINSEGGVLGRQIKLIIEDGKALPTESCRSRSPAPARPLALQQTPAGQSDAARRSPSTRRRRTARGRGSAPRSRGARAGHAGVPH